MDITRERWEQIERHLMECGYMAMTDADQAVCDAWDAGTLKFSDEPRMHYLSTHAEPILAAALLTTWAAIVAGMMVF